MSDRLTPDERDFIAKCAFDEDAAVSLVMWVEDRLGVAAPAPLDGLREAALARALADAVRQETGWLGEAKTDFWPNLGRDLALIAQRHVRAALRAEG